MHTGRRAIGARSTAGTREAAAGALFDGVLVSPSLEIAGPGAAEFLERPVPTTQRFARDSPARSTLHRQMLKRPRGGIEVRTSPSPAVEEEGCFSNRSPGNRVRQFTDLRLEFRRHAPGGRQACACSDVHLRGGVPLPSPCGGHWQREILLAADRRFPLRFGYMQMPRGSRSGDVPVRGLGA